MALFVRRSVQVASGRLLARSCRHGVRTIATTTEKLTPPADLRAPYNILFCGTDLFGLHILQRLHHAPDVCSHLTVLTPPERPDKYTKELDAYIVPPVRSYAQEHNFPILTVPSVKDGGLDKLALPTPFLERSPSTLMIAASFGHLIPESMRSHFHPTNMLNVHPSLLPQLRGAAPIQWAIAHQFRQTGVSIQTLAAKFDRGAIVARHPMQLKPDIEFAEARDYLAALAADVLLDTLRHFPQRIATAQSQADLRSADEKVMLAPKVQSSHCQIDWQRWDADAVMARWRAMGYLTNLWTTAIFYRKDRVEKLFFDDVSIITPTEETVAPHTLEFLAVASSGQAMYDNRHEQLVIRCKGEKVVCVKRLWTEGKKATTAKEWTEGYRAARMAPIEGLVDRKRWPVFQFGV